MLQDIETWLLTGRRRLAGALCLAVAAAFLTVAAWGVLAAAHGTEVAALVLGLCYAVPGALLLVLPVRARPRPAPAASGALLDAFLAGRAAGHAMHGGRRAR
ncbi:hypothetical protein M4578_18855 [Salipiger sp. P9]|uniref:hypothetical protein n=1 Tax=Salipiger pentaromativorans TaxID=2943193 RepID=UPI002157A04B|nr:hypothetical protein [Salipiger pentaromativorans]MCR8549892.1 hypothetical protein [Salipiger pentaromativorans]